MPLFVRLIHVFLMAQLKIAPRMSKFLESWYYMAVSFPDNLHCDMVVYRVRYKGMAHV